jgi:putative FmdB family regulatory protein
MVYEYRCPKCAKNVELDQHLGDPAPICCEENCNIEMERIISKTSFVLKGSGWYRDGYSSKKE